MLRFTAKGDFKNTERFFNKVSKLDIRSELDAYGKMGVNALESATPASSGKTAAAWDYEVVDSGRSWSIYWTNTHIVDGLPVVILLQYGHGTGTGGYVSGRDFINPALKPVFNTIAEGVWKVVTSS